MKIKSIKVEENFEEIVYDLEVADNHNYFVEEILVHNCHGASSGNKTSKSKRKNNGTMMRQICDLCINATWRFGFTGTLPTDPLEVRTIISGIGPVVNEVKASDLMEKGHVTNLKIMIPFISYNKTIVKEKIAKYLLEDGITEETLKKDIPINAYFNAEKKFIENYIPRLKLITKIVKSRLRKDENILILANTLKFGKNVCKVLNHLIKNEYNELYYISGEMNELDRKKIRQSMEEGSKIVIVATTSLFSTGISIKNLHTAIFSNMGKSKIKTIQSIGRTLRKHNTKSTATVFDLVDNLKYSNKHAKERLMFYSEEEYDHNIFEVNL